MCSGRDRYTCITCGNVYKSRKVLQGHKRKQHGDDVSNFTFFLCRKCHIPIPHIYSPDMDWTSSPFIFYGIVWQVGGNDSNKHTERSPGVVMKDRDKDLGINKHDDLVSILSQQTNNFMSY